MDIEITPVAGVVVVRAGGAVIAESRSAVMLRQPGAEPAFYLPRADVEMAFLDPSETVTTCPVKGAATHWHIMAKSGPIPDAAWAYEANEALAGRLAFDPERAAVERL
ncbi:DUF427 domain-containing protein [Rubrimonas cliftonensis]|uniref:Uncharacterized conserved protein, DUF427 family n=1 Tax=Rubrimonas cliftonensis TaxID=89524 RepID=A0A1H3Z4B8_9RHOB|nr:DUF427 domain-containing protein [Rubrimonas cliftonensis]SEA18480.1 Uncharacterized conserved protein, DUF427 family [Rubrimonas cliftonensis]